MAPERVDVVRRVDAGPEDAEWAAEELRVLARAGYGVAVRPEAGIAPELARSVLATSARILLRGEKDPAGAPALPPEPEHGTWPRVVDLSYWGGPRPRTPGDPLVIGILEPPDGLAGPSARMLRGVLPPGARVVLLGVGHGSGGGVARTMRARLPRGTERRLLGAGDAPARLAEIDVLVDLRRDGVWAARALGAGTEVLTPGVVPGSAVPAGAAGFPEEGASEEQVRTRLAELSADERARQDASLGARQAALERYGEERLLRAVTRAGARRPARAGAAAGRDAAGPRVLLLSSNGTGMGHLTRLLAMGRRAGDDVDVHVASLSQAVPVAATEGLPYHYFPSGGDLGIGTRRWNAMFARRLADLIQRLRPAVLVFDGAFPYTGLLEAAAVSAGTRLVWSRRPMWKSGTGAGQLSRSGAFDLVIEPGETAAAYDPGLTVGRKDAFRVRPIVLLDESELLGRDAACAELGLDPTRPAALVTLGAGNLQDITSDLGAVVAGLVSLDESVQVCVTRPLIASHTRELAGRVHGLSVYPVSRFSRAFDLAVSAAGYNSFHESVAFAVPTVFVPYDRMLDDQEARARWADDEGAGVLLRPGDTAGVQSALAQILEPAVRLRMAARCRELWPGNGASEAMAAVAALAAGASPAELLARSA